MSLITMMTLGSASPYRETVQLQGTSGTPISRNFLGYPSGTDAHVVFIFSAVDAPFNSIERGYVQWDGYKEGDLATYVNIHSWVNPIPWTGSYWIRATNEGDGISNTELDPTWVASHNLDQWYALTLDSSSVGWGWTHDGPQVRGGTIKVELADDSVGTTILATGYYRGTVSAEN